MIRATRDFVIVGAGPAGAALALLLARAGRSVALVDAAHFPRQKVCGEYLSPIGRRMLIDLGLGRLFDTAPSPTCLELTVPGGRRFQWHPSHPELRDAAAVSRWKLDAALVDAASAAGAEMFLGRRVRGVQQAGGRASGVLAVAVDDADDVLDISADVVIGADGRRSQVVRETGSTVGHLAGLVGFKHHATVDDMRSFEGRLTLHALPGGYVGACPIDGNTMNLCGVIPQSRLQASHGNIAAALRCWVPHTAPLRPLLDDSTTNGDGGNSNGENGRWSTMPDVHRQRSRPSVDGVLYIGDAMGTIEPLTGQGMTMAFASAHLAAQHLLRDPSRGMNRDAQRAYESAWDKQFGRAIRASDWFGKLLRHPKLLNAAIASSTVFRPIADFLIDLFHRRTMPGIR